MKTLSTTVYTAAELKEQFPSAFERALDNYRNTYCDEIPWMDETVDSLKELLKTAGVTLKDWSLGAYNRNFITIEFSHDEVEEFTGKRAFAWLENNLLCKLRVPWKGEDRKRNRKHGSAYYAGKIKPCPFTGYCADDDYLDALLKSVKTGDTLKEAFEGLADECGRILEDEADNAHSEEYFLEMAELNEWNFTEDGKIFRH